MIGVVTPRVRSATEGVHVIVASSVALTPLTIHIAVREVVAVQESG